jgi:poly(A) polymerase
MDRLDPQPWMTAAPVRRVMHALEAARTGSTRFVGGCVRNALLGEKVADIDIATQLTPPEVAAALRAAEIAVHPTGIEHGTLTAVADNQTFEVTTLRRDVETDGRRAVVAFTQDWAEDAQRRDFRMNALYASLDGTLYDPTGGGLADVRARRIVFVGDAETRIREDYLRILRFFRFNAWYGRGWLNAEGLEACGRLKSGLADISAERIWSETKKLLAARDPAPALAAMAQSGVFAQLYPEAHGLDLLRTLVGIEAVRRMPPDPMRRFLSLFSKDGEVLAAAARRLKLSNEERDRLVFSARDETPVSPAMSPAEIRRMLYQSGPVVFRDRVMLAWANAGGAGDWMALLSVASKWVRPVLPVTGQDVLAAGVKEGPGVGAAMKKLEAAWIASDFTAGRYELLNLLQP